MSYNQVSQCLFTTAYSKAWQVSSNIRKACTPIGEIDWNGKVLYLSSDGLSGYAINKDTKELTNVFSIAKGRGKTLLLDAISKGANNLDCFDGYLVELYTNMGFKEVKRETNWAEGEPDVIYMTLRG